MNLRDYLYFNKIKLSAFAVRLNIDYPQFYRIVHGINNPTLRVAVKIVKETKGNVTYEDLLVAVPKEKRQKKQKQPA